MGKNPDQSVKNLDTCFAKIRRRGAGLIGILAAGYATVKIGEGTLDALDFFALPDGQCPEGTFSATPTDTCEYIGDRGPSIKDTLKTVASMAVAGIGVVYAVNQSEMAAEARQEASLPN